MMFSFLNPAALWALPAAAGPVLLHLAMMRRARTVRFPDLALLREAYRRSLPSSRLRQWLLLACRCLALAALVLACARPVVHPSAAPLGGGGERGAAVVFLADVSYSMSHESAGRSRLRWAADAGLAMLGRLGPRDRVAVGAFSDRLESEALEWSSDAASARLRLERLKAGTGTTDFGPALRAAYALLRGAKAARRVIVLLSDGAAHGLRGVAPAQLLQAIPEYDPAVSLLALSFPEAGDNGAVESVRAEPASGQERIEARLSLSGAPRPAWDVSLWQRDAREDVRHLAVPAGSGAAAVFSLKPPPGASTWGRIEMRRDALPLDDAYHFALRTRARPRVLLVHGGARALDAGRGGWFWTKLFSDEGGGGLPYALDVVEAGRWSSVALDAYRAVVLTDLPAVPPVAASSLERFVRGGGGLLVIPALRQEASALQGLSGVLPGRLGPPRAPGVRSFGLRLDAEAAAAASRGERSAAAFQWRDFELENVAVAEGYELEPSASGHVWFRDAAGRPLLVAGAVGAGRSVLWASPLDLEASNLGLKPAFAAWADLILGYLTRYHEQREWRDLKVGQPIVRRWQEGEPAPALARVRAPDGRRIAVRVVDRRLSFEDTRQPGVYFIELEGAEPEPYAVNLDRSSGESDLAPAPSPPWRTLDAADAGPAFVRALFGREARGWALGALLLLLLAENLLSAAAPRPRASAEPDRRREGRAAAAALAAALLLWPRAAGAQEGDKLVWTQLRYEGAWDPYPTAHAEALQFLGTVTSVLSLPERRVIGLSEPALFSSPFVLLAGRQAPPPLDDDGARRLRDYLTAGGFLWIDDASGQRTGPFDQWVRRTLRGVFPDAELTPLPPEHVLHKTFFLLRSAAARTAASPAIEGIGWGGRTVVVYTRNDVLGALAKDALGNPLYPCVPGGEAQRLNARKIMINVLMYALTGNYKGDAVHQPYLLQKMRSGAAP